MVFAMAKKGPGRPKKQRFGPPSQSKSKRKLADTDLTEESQNEQPKKRGRPKGSRNRPKNDETSRNLSMRTRAEMAADPAYNNLDNKVCLICLFKFDDPLKKDKAISRCPTCDMLCHEPCLKKSGCTTCSWNF